MKIIKKILVSSIVVSVSITIGCQSKEINMSDNENSKALEFIEEVVDNKINKSKMGNSVQNILNGGLLAYDEENVYYTESNNIGNGYSLYKKNIENNEINKLVNDKAMYINIYDDYIYYVSSNGDDVSADEIVRIKKDGSERKVIIPKEERIANTSVQIIDDFLYYAVNIDGDNDSATQMDLMKINLTTLENNKVITIDKGAILSINNNGLIETYLQKYTKDKGLIVANKIVSKGEEGFTPNILDISDKDISSIIGTDDEYIYYLNKNNIENRAIKDFDINTILFFSDEELNGKSFLVGKDSIYYVGEEEFKSIRYSGEIIKIDIKTEETKAIKDIDIWYEDNEKYHEGMFNIEEDNSKTNDYSTQLFEVRGDLGYYNNKLEIVIEKKINIFNEENKSYIYGEFSIFEPNRKLTEDEAIQLAYYRVGDKLTHNGYFTEFEGRECITFKCKDIDKEIDLGNVYVDLNSGEVYLDFETGWKRYMSCNDDILPGTSYGWEEVNRE